MRDSTWGSGDIDAIAWEKTRLQQKTLKQLFILLGETNDQQTCLMNHFLHENHAKNPWWDAFSKVRFFRSRTKKRLGKGSNNTTEM